MTRRGGLSCPGSSSRSTAVHGRPVVLRCKPERLSHPPALGTATAQAASDQDRLGHPWRMPAAIAGCCNALSIENPCDLRYRHPEPRSSWIRATARSSTSRGCPSRTPPLASLPAQRPFAPRSHVAPIRQRSPSRWQRVSPSVWSCRRRGRERRGPCPSLCSLHQGLRSRGASVRVGRASRR